MSAGVVLEVVITEFEKKGGCEEFHGLAFGPEKGRGRRENPRRECVHLLQNLRSQWAFLVANHTSSIERYSAYVFSNGTHLTVLRFDSVLISRDVSRPDALRAFPNWFWGNPGLFSKCLWILSTRFASSNEASTTSSHPSFSSFERRTTFFTFSSLSLRPNAAQYRQPISTAGIEEMSKEPYCLFVSETRLFKRGSDFSQH